MRPQSLALLEGHELSWGGMQIVFGPARGAMLRGDYAAARERFAKYPAAVRAHGGRASGQYDPQLAGAHGALRGALPGRPRPDIGRPSCSGRRWATVAPSRINLKALPSWPRRWNRTERAARLFGAAEALREKIAMPMDPQERVEYDQQVAALRGRMDEEAFTSAWREGRALNMEQAISYAISDGDG